MESETEEQKENRREYAYEVELSSGNGSTGEFLDISDFINSLKSLDYQDESIHYVARRDKKIDIKYVKENIDNCPPIQSHLDYAKRVSKVIETLDADYQRRLEKGLPIDGKCLLWTNHNTGHEYWFSSEDLFRLKRSVGYRPNNCMEIDKEIIYMYDNWYQPMPVASTPQACEISQKLEIDFSNEEEVRGLLLNSALTGWSDRFDYYVAKLDGFASRAGLTAVESEIYKLMRQGNPQDDDSNMFAERPTQKEIAKKIGIVGVGVHEAVARISRRVVRQYNEEYEDYYYTFIERGTYQKCKKCKHNKLLNERNFRYRPARGTYDGVCKKCQS